MWIQSYKILAVLLFLIAGVLLGLSNVFYDFFPILANIMQGISTGVISGIILLFVTGLKSRNRGQLEEQFKAVCKLNASIVEINRLANDLTIKTYKRKTSKMTIGEYSLILERVINGPAYADNSFESILRNIHEALDQFEVNSGWLDSKNRKLVQEKVHCIDKDIHNISDSFNKVNDFIDRYELCDPSASPLPELIQVARLELDNITLMCRNLYKLYHHEYRLEEKIRAEITRIDRSLL